MYITLRELYEDDLPDDDEVFWSFVGELDLDESFPVFVVNPTKWFTEPDVGEDIPKVVYEEFSKPEQRSTVEHYRQEIRKGTKLRPVVFNDEILVDGHHRMVALALEGCVEFEAVQLCS